MSKLEHDFFGKNQNPSLPKAQQKKEKKDTANGEAKNGHDRLRLNFNIVDDEESWYDESLHSVIYGNLGRIEHDNFEKLVINL